MCEIGDEGLEKGTAELKEVERRTESMYGLRREQTLGVAEVQEYQMLINTSNLICCFHTVI
uniref:Uncharacterized protein n=1 Tax=Caenorhabditis brenneri TaxID=135651 RepID=B6VBK4_CAEBE|nr:hypothetical protein Cbre_JD12.005 [Caenorhabditis brenneri]